MKFLRNQVIKKMLELSEGLDAVRGADWAELSALYDYPAPLSESVIESFFESQNAENYDLLSSDIFQHLNWRNKVCKNYPFQINENSIVAKTNIKKALPYSFPLLLATHDFYEKTTIENWSNVGDLFELYCAASLSQQIGKTILIGNQLGNLPVDFDECLLKVCQIINERKGPIHPKARDFQDAGVDIIAYRKFDQRKGQIVVLIQCASGKNWRRKGGDIKPKLWSELVFWTVDPIKAMTFPFAYDFDSPEIEKEWIYASYDAGLLLDRLRLVAFDYKKTEYDFTPINKWVKDQVKKLGDYKI